MKRRLLPKRNELVVYGALQSRDFRARESANRSGIKLRKRSELGEVLPELADRIGDDRSRDVDGRELVATGAGLFIAIIAVLFLNHFNKRVRLALHQMDLLKVMVLNRLYGGGSAHQGVPVREAHAGNVTALHAGRAS